jgi:hypothetical protein
MDADAHPGIQARDTRPDARDSAHNLVAEDHRLAQPEVAYAAVVVVVKVGAADPADRDGHLDFAGPGDGRVTLVFPQVVDTVNN